MVQLGRVSSEFDVARMRDSFLRQFLEQSGDVTAAVTGASAASKDLPPTPAAVAGIQAGTQLGGGGKTSDDVAVLCQTEPKSMSSSLARHVAVADIVRCKHITLICAPHMTCWRWE